MKEIIADNAGTGRLKLAFSKAVDFLRSSRGNCYIITRRPKINMKLVYYGYELLNESDNSFDIFNRIKIKNKSTLDEIVTDDDIVIYDLKTELTADYKNVIIIKEI